MSSFADRFGDLTVGEALELNKKARETCEFEPKLLEWETYRTEAEAKVAYEKASKIKNATDLVIEETECCSL